MGKALNLLRRMVHSEIPQFEVFQIAREVQGLISPMGDRLAQLVEDHDLRQFVEASRLFDYLEAKTVTVSPSMAKAWQDYHESEPEPLKDPRLPEFGNHGTKRIPPQVARCKIWAAH